MGAEFYLLNFPDLITTNTITMINSKGINDNRAISAVEKFPLASEIAVLITGKSAIAISTNTNIPIIRLIMPPCPFLCNFIISCNSGGTII